MRLPFGDEGSPAAPDGTLTVTEIPHARPQGDVRTRWWDDRPTVPQSDILSQLPIYPDGKMMELARPRGGLADRYRLVQERGGNFGNDGAPVQRFPVRTPRGRL